MATRVMRAVARPRSDQHLPRESCDRQNNRRLRHSACTSRPQVEHCHTPQRLYGKIARRDRRIGRSVAVAIASRRGECPCIRKARRRVVAPGAAAPRARDREGLQRSGSAPCGWWQGAHKLFSIRVALHVDPAALERAAGNRREHRRFLDPLTPRAFDDRVDIGRRNGGQSGRVASQPTTDTGGRGSGSRWH